MHFIHVWASEFFFIEVGTYVEKTLYSAFSIGVSREWIWVKCGSFNYNSGSGRKSFKYEIYRDKSNLLYLLIQGEINTS